MQSYAYEFMEAYRPEWARLAKEFEGQLFSDLDAALLKARKLNELILMDVFNKEDIQYPTYAKHAERLAILKNEGVLDDAMFRCFDRIRRLGNAAAHVHEPIPILDGLHVHKNLYHILRWYFESYISYEEKVPEYQDPKQEDITDKLKEMMREMLPGYLNEILPSGTESKPDSQAVGTEDHPKAQGSYLLYQLNRLSESSREAVEGYKGLGKFKRYLHVRRPIEAALETHLLETANSHGSTLILLCGSVGDGKSHMLSHLSTNMPEIMGKFKIHNDATESFDPKLNSLDTLAQVLVPFSDTEIDFSEDKMILAINLGVLHNFLESGYAAENYNRLREYVFSANVFETNSITLEQEHPNFRLVNFGDYNMYELTKDGPVSSYITELFSRITEPIAENPFYAAYCRDKQKYGINTLLLNFEMFSSPRVQKQIIQLIIKTMIKDKIILSSRVLLNYIHDILVPSTIEETMTSDFLDMLPNLLPNLVFEGFDKSVFLKMLSHQDPIHHRARAIDESLVEFMNSGDYFMAFRNAIHDPDAQEWIRLLEPIENVAFLDQDTRREMSELFIRCCYLYESKLQEAFVDQVYRDYAKYLYAYNAGQKRMLQDLYYSVEKAIYLWKGSPKERYLYIDDEGHSFRIAEWLKLKGAAITTGCECTDVIERFAPSLQVGFLCEPHKEIHRVEIDLPLYELIVRVNNGYRLNKKDRDDSVKFMEFIESLLPYGQQTEEILISDKENGMAFILEYDSGFGKYSFRKEN